MSKQSTLRAHLKGLVGEALIIVYSNADKVAGHLLEVLNVGKRGHVLRLQEENGAELLIEYPSRCVRSLTIEPL